MQSSRVTRASQPASSSFSQRGRWVALVIFTAPIVLFGASLLVQAVGGHCPGDLLDNPERDCNFGGDLSFWLFVAAAAALAGAAAAVVVWLARRFER